MSDPCDLKENSSAAVDDGTSVVAPGFTVEGMFELVERLREILAEAVVPVERGRLHLEIGRCLAVCGQAFADEALEEFRQALELLPASQDSEAHAITRFEVGRLLATQGKVEEARVHLERGHALAEELQIEVLRIQCAIQLAFAYLLINQNEKGSLLLERERSKASDGHRYLLDFVLADRYANSKLSSVCDKAVALIEPYIKPGVSHPPEIEKALLRFFGQHHFILPPAIKYGALAWLDSLKPVRQDIMFIGSALRRHLFPNASERWMESEHRQVLVSAMRDEKLSLAERFNAGYELLGNIPVSERSIIREVVESLDAWRSSAELNRGQAAAVLHDLATAMLQLGDEESVYFERAVPLYEQALNIIPERDRSIVVKNLVWALLEVFKGRAKVSSPSLLPLADRIGELSLQLAMAERVPIWLNTATLLLSCQEMTHPACLAWVERWLSKALNHEAEHPHALRMMAWKDWIRYQHGELSKDEAESSLKIAKEYGHVSVFRSPSGLPEGTVKRLSECLAGRRSVNTADFDDLVLIAYFRPDVVELMFTAAEADGFRQVNDKQRRIRLYRDLAMAIHGAVEGEPVKRGKRLAKLVARDIDQIEPKDLDEWAGILRGPAGDEFRVQLERIGYPIRLGEPKQEASDAIDKQAQAFQRYALEEMRKGQLAEVRRDEKEAIQHFGAALMALDRAMALVKGETKSARAMIQMSAGNARRHLARVDAAQASVLLSDAEALYREALPWCKAHPELEPQCKKILADCLIQQKQDARWQEAMALYREALAGRPGGFRRFETLLAMSEAEFVCPGRNRPINLMKALERLEESLPHIDKGEADKRQMVAQRMLAWLGELARSLHAEPEACQRVAKKIKELWPEYASDARAAVLGLDTHLHVDKKGSDKEGFVDETDIMWNSGFMPELLQAIEPISGPVVVPRVPKAMREALQKVMGKRRDLRNDPEGLAHHAEDLRRSKGPEDPEQKAARLIGRVRVLGCLRGHGRDVSVELEQAAQEAEQAVVHIREPGIQAVALEELSKVWASMLSGRDFVRQAKLLERALAMLPKDWKLARAEFTGNFARATRYREDLPPGEAVDMAIPLYQLSIKLHRELNKLDGVVIGMQNLAEALSCRQDRPRIEALRESIALEREAIAFARILGGEPLGRLLSNLAYGLTCLAEVLPANSPEEKQCLEEAGKLFNEADPLIQDPELRKNVQGNRLIWQSRTDATGHTTIAALRVRLASFDPATQSREWARSAHNLAYEVLEKSFDAAGMREGLELYRKALELRPLDTQPDLHWESAQSLGAVLVRYVESAVRNRLRIPGLGPELARQEAEQCLCSAIQAARRLGSGPFLVQSARWLGYLALTVEPGQLPDLRVAALAMGAFEETLSLAPDNREGAEAEAGIAGGVAALLAIYRAQHALIQGVTQTGSTVLHGGPAWEILHWMLKARGGQYRRLKMRLQRPSSVRAETWTRWRQALRETKNWTERRQAADLLRSECPAFLKDSPSLVSTISWIKEMNGAAGMLLQTRFGFLLGVITQGENEALAHVVMVGDALPPESPEQVWEELRAPAVDADPGKLAKAIQVLEKVEALLRGPITAALDAVLPEQTQALLWSPHGIAAAAPLAAVWSKKIPVWTTPCITFPPHHTTVPNSGLLVFADPLRVGEPGAIPEGVETMRALSNMFFERGKHADVLMGCGTQRGMRLVDADGRGAVPGFILDASPSPEEVLARCREHSWIVFLAHGRYDQKSPERSSFLLIDKQGNTAELTVAMLAQIPDLLRGATLVLLSCESGAAGQISAVPDGLAGVLLAIGACVVVAPMRPVAAYRAIEVGKHLCEAAVGGGNLALALQSVLAREQEGRGVIDEPHRMLFGARSFVVWTG